MIKCLKHFRAGILLCIWLCFAAVFAGCQSDAKPEGTTTPEETTTEEISETIETLPWKRADQLEWISHPETACQELVVEGKSLVSEGVYHDYPEGEDSFFELDREEQKGKLQERNFFLHQGSGRSTEFSTIEDFLSLAEERTPAVLRLADWDPGKEEYHISVILFDGMYFYYVQYDTARSTWERPTKPYVNVFFLEGTLPNARMTDSYLVLTDYADLDFLTYAYAAGPSWDEEICSNVLCVLQIQY